MILKKATGIVKRIPIKNITEFNSLMYSIAYSITEKRKPKETKTGSGKE